MKNEQLSYLAIALVLVMAFALGAIFGWFANELITQLINNSL
jgi:hypothetical protein